MELKTDAVNRSVPPKTISDLVQCPNCDKQLNAAEVAQHCQEEMEQLQRMEFMANENVDSARKEDAPTDGEGRKPWTVFQKVKKNRHTRLQQHSRKRTHTPVQERACPICNKNFPQTEIENHVEVCLRSSRAVNGQNGHSSSDEDDLSDGVEEYEWGGEKRIRVSSLLEGGYAANGIGQKIINSNNSQENDEDEDLNVVEDDTHIYGPPQYEEYDIITPGSTSNGGGLNEDVTSYMRKLITNGERVERNTEDHETPTSSNASQKVNTKKTVCYEHIIDSLKFKLRQYEQQQQSKFKCLICLDDYKKPTISVSCWHVYCEDCWLRSLGTRKLCPQCSLITTAKDLRRIYM